MSGGKYEKLKYSPTSGKYSNSSLSSENISSFSQSSVEDPLLKEGESILHGDRKIHWNSLPNAIVSKGEASQLSELVHADHPHIQDTMIRQNGVKYVEIFLKMLKVCSYEIYIHTHIYTYIYLFILLQMRDEKHMKHILALMHDFIEGDKSRIRYFSEYMAQDGSVDPTLPLVNLLNVKSTFVQFMSALILGEYSSRTQ